MSLPIILKEWGWKLDSVDTTRLGRYCQKHQSQARNLFDADAGKNAPKDVVSVNKILNVQNFVNVVEGVTTKKNINTIKTSLFFFL